MSRQRLVLCLLLTIVLAVYSQAAAGRTLTFQIYANSDDFVANVESESILSEAILTVGGGIAFSENDYQMGNAYFTIKDDVFLPALTLGLGFKGVLGTAEVDHDDYDLMAIGFVVLGEYDFRKIYYNLPILLYADFTGSPDPLSFGDTDTYLEFNAGIKGYIVNNAALVLGYQRKEMRFDKDHEDDKLIDDAVYFGVELSF